MSKERTPMRKIKEVLCLKWSTGLGSRAIVRSAKVGKTTVDDIVRRASEAGLSWPLSPEMDDATLEQLLYPPSITLEDPSKPLPDWLMVHRELSRKGVTLSLLWHEYLESHRGGYQYSQFCKLYRENPIGSGPLLWYHVLFRTRLLTVEV